MQPGRLASLDGLRGVAAVIVVLHHALLTFSELAQPYYTDAASGAELPVRLIAYSPLHSVWAGTEAVYLFFVLSGLVLVRPVILAGRRFSWVAYYPRRIVRIYLPVIAAVLFGAGLLLLAPRFTDARLSDWVNRRPPDYDFAGMVQDAVLLFGPTRVISPLWSLQWEMLFSLLLPLFVLVGVAWRRAWALKTVLLLATVAVGALTVHEAMLYLPMFAIGAVLAGSWDAIAQHVHRAASARWIWPVVIVAAIVLATAGWTAAGLGLPTARRDLTAVAVLGVALMVLAAAHYGPLRTMLERRVFSWLGTISFALYLVHEPIIIAVRFLTFPAPSWVGLLIALPCSFLIAALFARWVERPAHGLSKRAGAAVEKRLRLQPSTARGQS